jgi:hypothetical protein
MRRRDLLGITAAAAVECAAAQERPLECRIVDGETKQPTPARVRLLSRDGTEVAPEGHSGQLSEKAQEGDVRFQSRRFSYVNGSFRLDPRHLPLKYQVIKGYEYVIAEGEITAGAALSGAVTIPLSRWSSIPKQGWYSGDIHIHHISPRTCRLEMEAEDLHVANILTSDFTTDQEQFEGKVNANSGRDRLIYVSQEFRHHELGHLCLLNLKQLIQPVMPARREHYPLHLEACEQTRAQNGYVSWAHFPSWPGLECPLDVVSEKLDGLEILSVLEPRDFPIFVRQVVPEMEANDGLRLWYRFLNCGFQLTATAGTDKMTNYVTVGANRVFAQVDGPLTYNAWIAAMKRGRTFITNSPMLSFTVNGAQAGGRIDAGARGQRTLRIEAKAESQLPYDRLEIVLNGQVIADATPSGARHAAEVRLEQPVTSSCWIAARAVEDLAPYRARKFPFSTIHIAEGTLLSNYYGTRRPETVFAHSSPVYVTVDGKPVRNWDDAGYYVRYMDNAIDWLQREGRFSRPSDKRATLDAFREGRAKWLRRQEEARG